MKLYFDQDKLFFFSFFNYMTDYKNTVIYRVSSNKNKNFYVGSTTNFLQRKYEHKSRSDGDIVNTHLYREIRKSGGWDTGGWVMELLERYPCTTEKQVLTRA